MRKMVRKYFGVDKMNDTEKLAFAQKVNQWALVVSIPSSYLEHTLVWPLVESLFIGGWNV